MTAYALYNEIDEYAADWLERLIKANLIAPGIVDRRSIEDLRGDDLRGFRQVHFFAGIGVWSYALRCAGISDDTPLWTGSCPCQPFSAAGKGGGVDDERHLWPALLHLFREQRPVRFLGEQVASKDGLGWLDLVQTDLEAENYTIGALDTCSAGSGAPHIRQRLRIGACDIGALGLGDSASFGRQRGRSGEKSAQPGQVERSGGLCTVGRLENAYRPVAQFAPRQGAGPGQAESPRSYNQFDRRSYLGRMDHHHHQRLEGLGGGHCAEIGQRQGPLRSASEAGEFGWLADCDLFEQREGGEPGNESSEGVWSQPSGCGNRGGLADDCCPRIRDCGPGADAGTTGTVESQGVQRQRLRNDTRDDGDLRINGQSAAGPTNGFWRDVDWLHCRDGKWRPVEPGTFPLVDGAAFRVGSGSAFEGKSRQGMLKAYGNAVDAEATVDFVQAYFASERQLVDNVAPRSLSLEDLLA